MEFIICSAIHKPGEKDLSGMPLIYCGLRHNFILWQNKDITRNPHHQGFLTSRNRFVNRKEAADIALACGQVSELKYFNDELDSLDLFNPETRVIPCVPKSDREELIMGLDAIVSPPVDTKPRNYTIDDLRETYNAGCPVSQLGGFVRFTHKDFDDYFSEKYV